MRHLVSAILPVTVLVVVPLAVESVPEFTIDLLFVVGSLLVIGGLLLLGVTVALFVRIGRGTLAPWDPPETLVVRGVYSHVRNPMITGVATALLGESMAAHSVSILLWSVAFLLINMVYFIAVEEPGLERRFGEAYRAYKRHVPRWLPRLRPWRPE